MASNRNTYEKHLHVINNTRGKVYYCSTTIVHGLVHAVVHAVVLAAVQAVIQAAVHAVVHAVVLAVVPECPSPTDSEVKRKVFPPPGPPLGFIFGSLARRGNRNLTGLTAASRVRVNAAAEVSLTPVTRNNN